MNSNLSLDEGSMTNKNNRMLWAKNQQALTIFLTISNYTLHWLLEGNITAQSQVSRNLPGPGQQAAPPYLCTGSKH